jgi:MFS family permease
MSTANATTQITSRPEMRGRVMSIYMLLFLGSTPIGGPIMGWISGHFGPRWSLAVGGISCLGAAGLAMAPRLRPALAGLGTGRAAARRSRPPEPVAVLSQDEVG